MSAKYNYGYNLRMVEYFLTEFLNVTDINASIKYFLRFDDRRDKRSEIIKFVHFIEL